MTDISLKDQVVEEIQTLPEPTLQEVLDFVEFLKWRRKADDPVLSVAGILSGDPLTAKEIETELYGQGATG